MAPPLEAIQFGFNRIGMVLRIAWLPYLLVIGLYIGAVALLTIAGAGLDGIAESDFDGGFDLVAPGVGAVILFIGMVLLGGVILSCISVAVTRAAAEDGYTPPGGWAYFALGPREVRYFVVQLLYGILASVSMLVTVGVIFALIALIAVASEPLEGESKLFIIGPGAILILLSFLTWLWIVLRFALVMPIAAIENRIAFGDAWAITKRNFWRLVVSGLIFSVVLQAVIFFAFVALLLIGLFVFGVFAAMAAVVWEPIGAIGVLASFLIGVPAYFAIVAFAFGAQLAYYALVYKYLRDPAADRGAETRAIA